MGWFNTKTAQQIDGAVSGENTNTNEAVGNATYVFGGGAGMSHPEDKRDCYQRGGCSSCSRKPDYCAIARQYLPADAYSCY